MTATRSATLLLLPGMDGSGALWGPLRDALGEVGRDATSVRYPPSAGTYDEILPAIDERGAEQGGGHVVVAESFGGPLAIRLAARSPAVRALVLVASFARAPAAARVLGPLARLGPHVPPRALLRWAMLGGERHEAIEDALVRAIAAVEPRAMRRRIEEVARVDVRSELATLRIPVVWVHAARDRLLGRPPPSGEVIDGPHLLAQTRPREIAARITRVLADLASSTASKRES